MTKPFAILLTSGASFLMAVVALAFAQPPRAAYACPQFRIVDVRAEYSHLVVEVEHFQMDCSFAYFENYLFQGREGGKHPRVVNAQGGLYLEDGTLAPERSRGGAPEAHRRSPTVEQYLPPGRSWLRYATPFMDDNSILSVVQKIHNERDGTGWTRGQSRLTVAPRDFKAADTANVQALVSNFQGLINTAWTRTSQGTLRAYYGPLPQVNPGAGLFEYGTVSTFYPDASVETTSVDGEAGRTGVDQTWTDIRTGAGNSSDDSSATGRVDIHTHAITNPNWADFRRFFTLFDTSSLDDGTIISAAVEEFVVTSRINNFTDSLSLITTTPASNTAVVNADYSQVGTTKQATDLTVAGLTVDSATYNTFTLNTPNDGKVSKTSITRFGIRSTFDNDNTPPAWVADNYTEVVIATAEEVLAGDKRPRLVVTHITPIAAITGTIGGGATEQAVRDGGGTIIITLTDTTWVAAGVAFDAERSNIIQGLDSAQSETYGWNAEVRDRITVGSVVRTSDTVVTITLTASEVAAYRVDSNETITVTVPASAVADGPLTATPTITITAAAETLTVTGTIFSTTRPADIVAGGRTLLLTLANMTWAAAGGAFDAQRQNIINNLDGDLTDESSWDNERGSLAVTDVVRTSSTVVTITLSAIPAYAIPSTETITATAPADAIAYGADITGSPTVAIVPTFPSSGSRVSAAIDLSAVTDVAFCAVGWEATTPTGTTLTVDTSVNGGSTYSSATNGSCPTGISVGSSLASITDFRFRVNMTTSVSGSSPFLDAFGLVIGDSSGSELYYRLNTIPGATLADRSSSGTHTGTMSFPVAPSSITSTAGIMESTRDPVAPEQALGIPQIVSEVSGAAVSTNLFNQSETGWAALPGYSLINNMSTLGDVPVRFMWFVFLGIIIIGMGFLALKFTDSMLIAALAMGAGIGLMVGIGGGLMPGWVLWIYIPIMGVFLLTRRFGFNP